MSNKGTEFRIKRQGNGLHAIQMLKGGVTPKICDCFYTGYKEAERVLENYLRQSDRLGYAEFPSKEKNVKS